MGPSTCLDGCGKSRPDPDSIPDGPARYDVEALLECTFVTYIISVFQTRSGGKSGRDSPFSFYC